MNPVNLYEAYSAVYNEDISNVDEDLSFVDDLSDNELVQIMEEILSEEELTLQECLDVFDAELLSEARVDMAARKAAREKYAAASEKSAKEARGRAASAEATARREKSAERERVGRKHAMKRLQVAATRAGKNLVDRAKSAGEKAKTLGAGAASAAAGGAAEAGRAARGAASAARGAASAAKAKVTGKLAAAKEKIKGLVKSGRKAVAGGLRNLASKVEPKETENKGKEVKAAAKKAIAKASAPKALPGSPARKALPPVGKTKSGKDLTPQQRGMQTAAQNARLAKRLGEDFEVLAEMILEDLISEGYAETFEGALAVLESYSDYEVGEIAEGYLTEERVDLYDVVLEHLLSEGYADTEEAATVIMANMSEEWRKEILSKI